MRVKSQTKSHRRSRLSGFTIVEVLVAFGIGGIVFVSLYAGLAQGFDSVRRAHHRLRATQILTEKLEVVRLYNWTQVTTPGFIPAAFTESFHPTTNGNPGIAYTGILKVAAASVPPAYTNTMRSVVAEVTWILSGVTNKQSMETLISEHGIQNYIY